MSRRGPYGGVSALGNDRIMFDFEMDGIRCRPPPVPM